MRFGIDQQAALIDRITKYFINNPGNALWVEAYKPPRSKNQQALLHCIIRDISIHGGYSEDWTKECFLKYDCNGFFPHWPKLVSNDDKGNVVFIPRSESVITKVEESERIERLYALGAEWGITWTK